jgi:hypothetical protein
MRTKLTAVAALAAAMAMLATVAAAGPVATKQRVAIKIQDGASFVLTPLTSGAVKPDAAYAGLVGGGLGAGATTLNGRIRSQFEGFLGPK